MENNVGSEIKFNIWDWVLVFVFVLLVSSMVFAPYLIGVDYEFVVSSLLRDLDPWPLN